MIKKVVFLFIVFFLTLSLYAAGIRDAGRNGEFILLHTNDFHGALIANSGRGGIAEIAAVVSALRAANPNVLLLDAGDFNTGSALSNMFHAEPVIRAYNMMKYDALTFGNHEFDANQEILDEQIKKAEFPFVSSNVKKADGSFLGGNRYIVKKFDDVSVGIFGLTTLRTSIIASPDKTLTFINEIEAARDVVEILRNIENVDIIIGLTHLGDVKESVNHITSVELANAVEGIDIIIDGHSHSFFSSPKREGNTFIVTANEWGKYLGCARIVITAGKLVSFDWHPVPIGANAEIIEMLKPYIEKANVSLKEVIGEASDNFIFGNRLTRYQETAIGNLITDANAWFLRSVNNQKIDFVLHNGGNIRAELPKGKITREQILTILPFENYLFTAKMTGQQVIELFDFIAAIPQGSGGFPQFSSDVRLTVDKTSGGGAVKNLTIGGSPVDRNKIYTFCTNDYILGGGDGYEIMKSAAEPFNVSLLLSYVVSEYIKAKGEVTPALDGRLIIIGGVE